MPAISKIAACREETAELEELLLRLQAVSVESGLTAQCRNSASRVVLDDWQQCLSSRSGRLRREAVPLEVWTNPLDTVKRKLAVTKGIFMQSRSEIAKTCRNLLKLPDGLPDNIKTGLQELAALLETNEPKEKEQTVTRIAVKWRNLKVELDSFLKNRTGMTEGMVVAMIQVQKIMSQMDRYAKHWKSIFDSANAGPSLYKDSDAKASVDGWAQTSFGSDVFLAAT